MILGKLKGNQGFFVFHFISSFIGGKKVQFEGKEMDRMTELFPGESVILDW